MFASVMLCYSTEDLVWRIPAALFEKFKIFPYATAIQLDNSEHEKQKLIFFSGIFSLRADVVHIASAVEFSVSRIPEGAFEVLYNQEDRLPELADDTILEEYQDTSMQVCAKVLDKKIVAVAYDNGNGALSIATRQSCQGKGYATECLSKLIQVYPDRSQLGYATELDNLPALRVAQKCGLVKASETYWFTIDESAGLAFHNAHPELFS